MGKKRMSFRGWGDQELGSGGKVKGKLERDIANHYFHHDRATGERGENLLRGMRV